MRVILLSAVLLMSLLAYVDNSRADANDGELFGFSLGTQYTEQSNKTIDNGRLTLITTLHPVKPDAVNHVFVLVTPMSRSIGKIVGETWYASGEDALVAYEQFRIILRNKYSHWNSDETSEQNLHASRLWSGNYELSVQVSGPHRNNPMMPPNKSYQLLIALVYKPSTSAAVEFESMADAEIAETSAGQFTEDEIRGL